MFYVNELTDSVVPRRLERPEVSNRALTLTAFVVVITVAVTLGAWATSSGPPAYEARSVIGPVWSNLSPSRIPRTVSSLIDTTSLTLAEGEGLVVTPVEDTQLTLVSYRSDDRELARAEADAAAATLVADLNDRGRGLGRFTVVTPAEVRARSKAGPLPSLLMGLLAGACFAGCAFGVRRAIGDLRAGVP